MVRLLLILVTLALASCSVPLRECAKQTDCFGGEACVNGRCVVSVATVDGGADAPPTDQDRADLPSGDCRLDESVCGAQICNVSTGRCEACQRDLQCGDGGLCDMVKGLCSCAPAYHSCGGTCERNDDVETCGDRCDACPGVDDGTATCVAGTCDFRCDAGFRACDGCPFDRDCIQCEQSAECATYEAARCDTGSCVECASNADCAHLDRKVCADGVCVECDIGDSMACGNNSCNPATHFCTNTSLLSRQWCESCVADSECEPNHRCVPMFFAGSQRPRAYCLMQANAMCTPPDPIQVQRDSLSGIAAAYYCALREDLTTCEALRDFGHACDQDSDCGTPLLADARCRLFDGLRQCTYACTDSEECIAGTTCIGNPPDNSYCARF